MEIENHGSGQGCTVLESHWEQRILEGELMVSGLLVVVSDEQGLGTSNRVLV